MSFDQDPNEQANISGADLAIMIAELKEATKQRDTLLVALEFMLERISEPPEANCSCHISPPCNDCVDFSGEREAFEFAKNAIASTKGGA